jgi:DNA polymerase-3 subunit gamma/tau
VYQALYRKWRPIVFEDVLGQDHITTTIKNQVTNQKLSHAYLFSGSRGTGKTSTAKILSRAVNCINPQNGNPCNECHPCLTSLNNSAVDIIEIDAASNNKVDDARIIRDEVIYTPAELKYKVYIIDEAHMLTNQAFNALLKTLEEPPSHIIFIFATTEPHKFPPTILSRCQRFDFKRITPFDTEKRIKQIIRNDEYTISDEAISLLCRIADGSMRDALSILDQCLSSGKVNIDFSDIAEVTGVSDPNFIYDFAQKLIDCDLSGSFSAIKEAYENGRDIEKVIDDLIAHFRNLLVSKTLDNKEQALEILMVTNSAYRIYESQSKALSIERILRYIDILSDAVLSQKYANNPRLCAEVAITGILKRPDITDPQGILERLLELENKVMNGNFNIQPEMQKQEIISPKVEPKIVEVNTDIQIQDEQENLSPTDSLNAQRSTLNPDLDQEVYNDEEVEPPCETDYETPTISDDEIPKVSSDLENSWDDIITLSIKNADFGFKKIMNDVKVLFKENAIEIIFENETFFGISKMNKYDDIIKKSAKSVTGKDILVRIHTNKEEQTPKDSNYDYLIKKLEAYGDNISFI